MTKLVYTPPFLESEAFKDWQERAKKVRNAIIEAKKKPDKFNEGLYQEFKKEFLVQIGWCAYCEGRYDSGEFGDAEHYRPKGDVTQKRVAIENHDGYYWLAYEWHNLLLACRKCNSTHPDRDKTTKKEKVSHPGKLCEFPVEGARICTPSNDAEQWIDELVAENPMLLHPYFDSYEEHFTAELDGWIHHKTERGRITIDICDLNRKELRTERKKAEDLCIAGRVNTIWNKELNWKCQKLGGDDEFRTYLNGRLRDELKRKLAEFEKMAFE